MTLIAGKISENDLMSKLVSSKKIMQKIDSNSYEKGFINENALNQDVENYVPNNNIQQPKRNNNISNIDKINNSNLPDVIKRAMIENPIEQISLNDGLNMNIVEGAKRLMELDNSKIKNTNIKKSPVSVTRSKEVDLNSLVPIIENVVRKVMDEKLNQILSTYQTTTLNETLVLKVGDSIFKGKITGVNSSK
jgi:hypothetical protein